MQYNQRAQLDPSQMGGSRGGRAGGVAVGGGASIVVIVLALLFGFDPGALLATGSAPASQTQPGDNQYAHCRSGADITKDPECRWVAYTNSIQAYWTEALPGYRPTKTVTFDQTVNTGCGQASAQVGPFYCPADETVYLDKAFFSTLLTQLRATGGDAAEAYVIAHEYGHHIQNLTGFMEQAQRSRQTGPSSAAVRLELQADCFAGAWLRYADSDQDNIIAQVTQDDLDRAVNAAEAVGDDHIQRLQTGRIDPDSWTHGSSAMRKLWLARGFETGDPNQCNTFAANAPGF